MEESRRHINITISGRVQGVAFRYSARSMALHMGLKGFVKNMPDGDVYIEVEGSPVQADEFLSWCREGPSRAHVKSVFFTEGTWRGFQDFEIRF